MDSGDVDINLVFLEAQPFLTVSFDVGDRQCTSVAVKDSKQAAHANACLPTFYVCTPLILCIQSLSPCPLFAVDSYVVMFFETANDFGVEPESLFQTISIESADRVSHTVTAADGLLTGREYNLTIIANNSAGTTLSSATTCKCKCMSPLCKSEYIHCTYSTPTQQSSPTVNLELVSINFTKLLQGLCTLYQYTSNTQWQI